MLKQITSRGKALMALRWWVTVLILVAACERPLAAYTDPGSGALLWQLIVAAFVGAMFYVRRIAHWIRNRYQHRNDAG
jgi:hypothetical protein